MGIPGEWSVVAIPNVHVLLFDDVVMLHLIVGPGKPHPCVDWRLHHNGGWLVDRFAGGGRSL